MSNRIIGTTSFGEHQVTLHVQDLEGNIHYIDVTKIDFHAYEDGELIQNCFPYLTPEQRELIISGMTDEMWNVEMDKYNEMEEDSEMDNYKEIENG